MPKISDSRRSDRKARVYELIRSRGSGIRTVEIANILNVPERTVRDYLIELEAEYKVTKEGWYWLPVQMRQPIKLEPTPDEAVVLYIALRMFVKQSDRRNPLAETLLLKMAQLANTELHLGDSLEQAAAELAQRPIDPDYEDIFLQVVRAYLHRRKLEITYHPYRSEPFITVIEPYLIEPSGIGFGTYALGFSSTLQALRTYKLERIQKARLTNETFTVPIDFPGLEILRSAWSIYYGEANVHVRLRFAPEVARRVRESNWRGLNPEMTEVTDGYLDYAFDIAATTDLKPWIRTWGANVEVLEPATLRDELIGEARALAHLYGWETTTARNSTHSRFDDIFGG